MSLKKYKTAKKLEISAKFGEVMLIILLIYKLSRLSTPEDLSFLTGVFFLAIIVMIANVIVSIVERKALKDIETRLKVLSND